MKFFQITVLILLLYSVPGISPVATAQALDPDETARSFDDAVNRADQISSLRSLLIQQNGTLIREEYFDGRNPNRAFNIKSASKSIITLLVGIAVEQGQISSIEQTLGEYFPDYFEENPDPKKEKITIRQMLSMQAGLETTSFYNYGAWVISDDWVEFQLDQDFVAEPGGEMVYSTGISHLLSVILTIATGQSTRSFANEHFFDPMNIRVGGWDRDPEGYYMGGNNLALKPADMLKIGQMLLNGGEYNGLQIITDGWLEATFSTYTRSNYNPYDYGYMWWNKPMGSYQVYFAWGYGGQYIFIIPQLESVVVMTSSLANASQQRSYKEPVLSLLENEIIPVLEKQVPP